MGFNLENKVQYKTLAPSLQKILDAKAEKIDLQNLNTKFNALNDSIVIGPTDPGATGTKVWFNTDPNDRLIRVCINGSSWIAMGAVGL